MSRRPINDPEYTVPRDVAIVSLVILVPFYGLMIYLIEKGIL